MNNDFCRRYGKEIVLLWENKLHFENAYENFTILRIYLYARIYFDAKSSRELIL